MRFAIIFVTVSLVCATSSAALKPVGPTSSWSGVVRDATLLEAAPSGGFIADAATWEKLWKAWRAGDTLPKVDFSTEIILIGTAKGAGQVFFLPSLHENGDLRFTVASARKGGPGFGYLLAKVSKRGIKMVNGMPVETKASKRADQLKKTIKDFRLNLAYVGPSGKPYYNVSLSMPPIQAEKNSPFNLLVQITEKQAITIVDHLASSGFLEQAGGEEVFKKLAGPCYLLNVRAGKLLLASNLDWGREMLRRLDGLHKVLDGDAAKAMERLLTRLSGHRKQWETLKLRNGTGANTRILITSDSNATTLDITSPVGIDRATIERLGDEWPKSIRLRLHLKGLESLRIGNGADTLTLSVSSTGSHESRISLVGGGVEKEDSKAIGKRSPYWTEIRVVGAARKIPLKGGYFEITLPPKLLEKNPKQITIEWVDFYR